MPTDHHLDPDEDALAQLGYETEDVEYKGLGRSIGWFFVFVFGCGAAGLVIFGAFIGFDKLKDPPANTSPFVKRIPAEGTPLLQTNETARSDIMDLRRKEDELLHGKPTWVDHSKGIVRIPVESAIDLYLSRNAPNASKESTIISGTPPRHTPEETEGAAHE
jgi:hypothetical protein